MVAHHESTTGASHRRTLSRQSVVEFATRDGRTQRFTDGVARQGGAMHDIGESVTVRYDAKDPSRAEIASSTAVKVLGGGVLLLFSGVGVAAGWLLLRLRGKSSGTAPHAPRD